MITFIAAKRDPGTRTCRVGRSGYKVTLLPTLQKNFFFQNARTKIIPLRQPSTYQHIFATTSPTLQDHILTMKFMTTNFVQCAVRSCSKTTDAFPLQYTDLTLIRQETEFDSAFILNILPRLDWNALVKVASEVGSLCSNCSM